MVSFIDTLQSIGGDTHETKNVCGSYLNLGYPYSLQIIWVKVAKSMSIRNGKPYNRKKLVNQTIS